MKNYDCWKKFIHSGKIDDYLNYIACTREDIYDDSIHIIDMDKEGDYSAGINYGDGNGTVSHASW